MTEALQARARVDLLACLRDLGWTAEEHPPGTWRATLETEEAAFPLELRIDGGWLTMVLRPFLALPGPNPFELSRWLLRQNWDMPLAKFGYDERGRTLLAVELPLVDLDRSEVRAALSAIESQAVAHRRALRDAIRSTPP